MGLLDNLSGLLPVEVRRKLETDLNDTEVIGSANVTDGSITTAKLAAVAVTTAKITDANVTTAKIADANVTTAKIADANVTTAKILDANVTTAKIADANVTTAKIAATAVTGPKINAASTFFSAVFAGVAAAGPVTLTGAAVGDKVIQLVNITDEANGAASFEATITIINQIQQSSASNLTTKNYSVLLLKQS